MEDNNPVEPRRHVRKHNKEVSFAVNDHLIYCRIIVIFH